MLSSLTSVRVSETQQEQRDKQTRRDKSVSWSFSISSSVMQCYVGLTLKHHPLLISAALSAGCPLSLPLPFIHSSLFFPLHTPAATCSESHLHEKESVKKTKKTKRKKPCFSLPVSAAGRAAPYWDLAVNCAPLSSIK